MLKVENIASGYRQKLVIEDITFEVKDGEVIGLLGLNGAGKSTLLKTILGLLKPSKGTLELDGVNIEEDFTNYAKGISYIPESPLLYEELTLKEHIEITALGYGLDPKESLEKANGLLELFRLDKYLDWFPAHFSKGMRQKVMLVCALITDAKLLIIDEPFVGLDPLAINHLTKVIKDRSKEGTSVLLTTHVLQLAQDLCDSYILLDSGKIVAKGSLEELQEDLSMQGSDLTRIYTKIAGEES